MGIELFERAVRGGGQLLNAEVCPLAGRSDRVSRLLLTFDLGRIDVSVDPVSQRVRADFVASPDEAPPGVEDARQEEPWWRVLGSPLACTWEGGAGHEAKLCLQFRADDQSPRVIALEPDGGSISICLEPLPD